MLLVAASVAMVVWIAVAASMLFARHPESPTDQVAPSGTPAITSSASPTPTGDGYSPSDYTGPLPTAGASKPPDPTAHPPESTTADPTTSSAPTAGPTGSSPTASPSPTHPGKGHGHGPGHTPGPRLLTTR